MESSFTEYRYDGREWESGSVEEQVLKEKLDREFIEALDALFPEKTPHLKDSLDEIRYASGQRSVVLLLRSILGNG